MILSDILNTCGDHKNEPSYRKIVATYSEPLIRMALSETRQAHLEGRILKTKGAYFTDTLKRLHQMHEQRGLSDTPHFSVNPTGVLQIPCGIYW